MRGKDPIPVWYGGQPNTACRLQQAVKKEYGVSNETMARIDQQLGERYPTFASCQARVVKARFDGLLSWDEYLDYVNTVSTRRSIQPQVPAILESDF
jgi:hypothetical protein